MGFGWRVRGVMSLAMMHGWLIAAWWLIALAVVATVVLGVVVVQRAGSARGRRGALDVLDERYASGEIEEDEYRQRRRLLKG